MPAGVTFRESLFCQAAGFLFINLILFWKAFGNNFFGKILQVMAFSLGPCLSRHVLKMNKLIAIVTSL